jgi:hypothetical protein
MPCAARARRLSSAPPRAGPAVWPAARETREA